MPDKEISLRNCKFAFRCARTWDSLQPSGKAGVRYCDDCEQNVTFCKTDHELIAAVQANKCVAIILTRHEDSDHGRQFESLAVGRMSASPYKTAAKVLEFDEE